MMAYGDAGTSNGTRIAILAAMLLGAMVIAAAVLVPWKSLYRQMFMNPAQIENQLLTRAKVAPVMQELKADFPDAFRQLAALYSKNLQAGLSDQETEAAAGKFMTVFFTSKADAVGAAPTSRLVALAKARSTLYDGLKIANVEDCGAITLGSSAANERQVKLIAPVSRLLIAAAHAGELKPVKRNTASLSRADTDLLVGRGNALGMTQAKWLAINSPAVMQTLPAADQCDIMVIVMKAVADLPPASAANLTAVMIVSTLKEGS